MLVLIAAGEPCWGQQLRAWRMETESVSLQGVPIRGANRAISVLTSDGQLHPLAGQLRMEPQGDFRPLTQGEMRAALTREFGRKMQVSQSSHYLVVHPPGQGEVWVERFESIYRAFRWFFQVRGTTPRPPRFPLAAIVFPTQQDMMHYAIREGARGLSPNLRGYYSHQSNRIVMYDVDAQAKSAAWQQNNATLIHEAAHQIAFNTGLHSRYAPPPRWLVEGLGCLFEAPGIWNATAYPNRSDRLNQSRLADFTRRRESRRDDFLVNLITEDESLFRRDGELAYAEAWALTFFLSEHEPKRYLRYLTLTASRPPDKVLSAADKLREFASVFGDDWSMLESRCLRLLGTVGK